jgi:predicted  nucleic acid-binding Zn-ribbon protein
VRRRRLDRCSISRARPAWLNVPMPHYHCPACGSLFQSERRDLLERCECGHALDCFWTPNAAAEAARRPERVPGAGRRRFRRDRRRTAAV